MKKILVVDDDFDLREILKQSLAAKGYEVFAAENGLKALEIINTEKIDAILSDIHMPEMDGEEFLRTLHKRSDRIPVVLFFSEAAKLTLEDAYDLGAVAILRKPCPKKKILETLSQILVEPSNEFNFRPPRYEESREIELRFVGFEHAQRASLFNIGRGGAFVKFEGQLPKIDSQIFFKIQFVSDELALLSGVGVVRWVRANDTKGFSKGFGMEFIFLDEPGRSQFKKILNKIEPRQFIPKI